jgi:hypothetical protein
MRVVEAEPYPFELASQHCALVIIDMQRDFLEPGGFGAALGNDVSRLRRAIGPTAQVLEAVRRTGMLVVWDTQPTMSNEAPVSWLRGSATTNNIPFVWLCRRAASRKIEWRP